MEDYRVQSSAVIPLGRRGENKVRRILFPIPEAWQGGEYVLLCMRPGDREPYPVAAVCAGDNLAWVVSSADTCRAGMGRCELQWLQEDMVAKSVVYDTFVAASLPAPAEAPEPQAEWVAQLLEAVGDRLRAAKESGDFDGHTPEKGVDYWTAADKEAMAREAADLMESAQWIVTDSVGGHMEDSADAPIQGLTVYGCSTQNGAQTPIVSVGDSGSLNVVATDGTQSNTVTITEGLPLRGIGDFRDELIVGRSGNYLKRRIAVYNQQALTASHISTSGSGDGARRALGGDQFSITGSALQGTSGAAYTGILCANLPVVSQLQERSFDHPVLAAYGHAGNLELRLRFPMGYTDEEILRIAKSTYVLYPLREPQIIPLTDAQVQSVLTLRTFKPVTDITAEGADLEVRYVADPKLYIDQKFAQLQALILEG